MVLIEPAILCSTKCEVTFRAHKEEFAQQLHNGRGFASPRAHTLDHAHVVAVYQDTKLGPFSSPRSAGYRQGVKLLPLDTVA